MVDYIVLHTDVPIRMCVACRKRRPQHGLLRIVHAPGAAIILDNGRHRSAGRGAYLCPDLRCIEMAERRQLAARVLKGQASIQLYEDLRRVCEQIRESQATQDME